MTDEVLGDAPFLQTLIAKQQAVEARRAELTAGGGLLVQSVLVQKVSEAGKIANHNKSGVYLYAQRRTETKQNECISCHAARERAAAGI